MSVCSRQLSRVVLSFFSCSAYVWYCLSSSCFVHSSVSGVGDWLVAKSWMRRASRASVFAC